MIEADIKHPTDSGLAGTGCGRWLGKAQAGETDRGAALADAGSLAGDGTEVARGRPLIHDAKRLTELDRLRSSEFGCT